MASTMRSGRGTKQVSLRGAESRRRVVEYLDRDAICWIADSLIRANCPLDRKSLLRATDRVSASDHLFERANQYADLFADFLPRSFDEACAAIIRSLEPPRSEGGYGPLSNYRLLILTRFISRRGIQNFEPSMRALKELTKRFTAEFDIRPFIFFHESRSIQTLLKWQEDPDLHVRRLVAEGTRTRLPWCAHLKCFQAAPKKVLRLIAPLREDSSPYVRLSVANNLADILKDDLEVGLNVAEEWCQSASRVGKKVVKHAIRYYVSRADPRALEIDAKCNL